jgi:hypothetical protein
MYRYSDGDEGPCYGCWYIAMIALIILMWMIFGASYANAEGPINSVGPAPYQPGLYVNWKDTHWADPEMMFPDVMRVMDNRGRVQMRVKMDGSIALYNGARIQFDGSRTYTRPGPRIGYIEVYIGSSYEQQAITALIPIYEVPDVNP